MLAVGFAEGQVVSSKLEVVLAVGFGQAKLLRGSCFFRFSQVEFYLLPCFFACPLRDHRSGRPRFSVGMLVEEAKDFQSAEQGIGCFLVWETVFFGEEGQELGLKVVYGVLEGQ